MEAPYLCCEFIASLSRCGNISLHLHIYCFHTAARRREREESWLQRTDAVFCFTEPNSVVPTKQATVVFLVCLI